jgi:hypothetical protein
MPRNIRERRASSSSSSNTDTEELGESNLSVKEKIEELKFLQKQRERTSGIDVYSLAIGESSELNNAKNLSTLIENDPWKIKTGGLVDMKVVKEKRGNDIVKSMNSNFAKETNQRDEDAEMQKFIEEQLSIKKEAERAAAAAKAAAELALSDPNSLLTSQVSELSTLSSSVKIFKRPEDALFDVPAYLIENRSKNKSEESMSEQMLSGIPEVDLGVDERIRNIEDTERAKQKVGKNSQAAAAAASKSKSSHQHHHHHNKSTVYLDGKSTHTTNEDKRKQDDFVQHKRFDDALINPDNMIKPRLPRLNPTLQNQPAQPTVGDGPKHELLQQQATSKTSGDSNSSAQRRNNHMNAVNAGRPNARRKYFVSTNQNEPESEQLSTSAKRSHAASASVTSTAAAATTTTAATANAGTSSTSTATERASDDYCLERFKKNMRFSRSSKIKIA